MKIRSDLTGMRFGKWTVLGLSAVKNRASYWLCRCDCGSSRAVVGATLKNGKSSSCGCNIGIAAKARLTTHGLADSKPHMIWVGMRQRCENPRSKAFAAYGGRGIRVCAEWHSFDAFWADMGPTYKEGLSIERLDVDGDYCPANCAWIEKREQSKNRRPSSEWSFRQSGANG